jgi:D-glycero-D-manno-heptose 1,7-bisphosphate phosphatase
LQTQQHNQTPTRTTQAVILAGGRGERMRPLTDLRPKPMIEMAGKPFLEHQIELLREQGFKRVLLLLGYLPEVVQNYFGDGSRFGIQIEYSVTPIEDLTGQRLRSARDKLDDIFLLVYCDNYWPMQMDRMWQRFVEAGAPAMLTIYANRDGYTKDTLRVDEKGFVSVFEKERRGAADLKGVEISYGIFRKDLLDLLPDGNVSFEETVYPSLAKQGQLAAYVTEHRYYSIGSIARLPLTEFFLERHPAAILDRDGVLNERPPKAQYVRKWPEFKWLPGAKGALRHLNEAGFKVIVISNQAGIGRGEMSEADLMDIHRHMVKEAQEAGGRIDAIYYCPHNWEEGCECRKPRPGMLFQAQHDFSLDLSRTVFVGDDDRDRQAAEAAGCGAELVSDQRPLREIITELIRKRKQ